MVQDKRAKQYVVATDKGAVRITEEDFLLLRKDAMPDMPSNPEIIKNLIKSGKQAVMSGFKQVSEEEQTRRHQICKWNCEWYRTIDDRCAKCGCFTRYKSRLEAWHCPIDKW